MPEISKIGEILQLEQRFKKKLGFSLLRPEAKLLLTLKSNGSLSIKEAMSFLDLSYRGFYMLLKKLEISGVVYLQDDPKDKRVKRISLSKLGLENSNLL